jgi:hypothetical protein
MHATIQRRGEPGRYAASASRAGIRVTPLELNCDWDGNAGFGSGVPGFYVDTSPAGPAVVHLQGAVRQVPRRGPNPLLIGVLPPDARPDRSVYELVHTFNGTYAGVEIDHFGNIYLIDAHSPAVGDLSFVSLEGISFQRLMSDTNVPVPVHTANWSGESRSDAAEPSAWRDESGVVHLQGAVARTSSHGPGADVIGTLPETFRPSRNVFTIAHTFAGTYVDLFISALTGQIILIGARGPAAADGRLVSLEGITFTDNAGFPITVHTADYSGSTVFNTFSPSAHIDLSGVVHLVGAVARTSGTEPDETGTGAKLVGTVPAVARPRRNVYQIVHTNSGTYANVVITTAGHIRIIGPRPPMVTDLSFVSLDGLSYQP